MWLSVSLGTAHTLRVRAVQTTHTRGWQEKMDLYVFLEVMMRDGSWHVSDLRGLNRNQEGDYARRPVSDAEVSIIERKRLSLSALQLCFFLFAINL